jgi:hypothetical protein
MFSSSRIRRRSTQRVTLLSVTAVTALVLAVPGWTQRRPTLPRVGSKPNAQAPLAGGLVTHDLASGGETPQSLIRALVSSDAVVSNIQYSGAPIAAGTFTGGTGIIGFESGVILSSGNIANVVGPINSDSGITSQNSTPGDPDLEAILGGQYCCTHDASILEFDLECSVGNAISFQYVFSSEEYDELPTPVNDLFACFLNGHNIALIPGTNSPIAIQSVNCGHPYNPPSGSNCGYYITNDCISLGLVFPCTNIATEMDGLTVVLSATGMLQPGPNHIKLAIADTGDDQYDSNVLIRGQSLSCTYGPPLFESPSCGQTLHGYVGVPLSFTVVASAGSGLPGESVTLDVTGDAVPLASGTFVPPLPAGPAQPVSSQFQWTPTAGDIGDYRLTFTATDQLQQSTPCEVRIRVDSSIPPPTFLPPSPCGQVLEARTGDPFSFEVAARAENSAPGESVTLTVTGDAIPLAGGTFVPPLPAGPAQPVSSQFQWTPTAGDIGDYHLTFTVTDQLQQSAPCDVWIHVALSPPTFLPPSPCGQVLYAWAGDPFSFEVAARSENSAPGESVTLTVTGDAIPLAGGTFVPPLPAGPAQPVSSQFQWTPTATDVGLFHLYFTATDQLQQTISCDVTIQVFGAAPGTDLCQAGMGGVRDCPCSNPPAASPGGCDNSSGTGGARLDSLGRASVSHSTVVFTTTGEESAALSVVVQGNVFWPSGAIYGQGVRCVSGRLKRLYVKSASGGSITAPEQGDLMVPARSAHLGDFLTSGTSRYYAVYYRDPTILGGCPATSTFNVTQTQMILWTP